MCSKLRNEVKDNIDQDIDVCTIGVQTIMQSDHGTPRNQNKLKILWLIFISSVWDSCRIAVDILKFDQKKEKSLSRKYSDVLTIALWSKWQLSKGDHVAIREYAFNSFWLLVEHLKKVIILEKPSILPWITNPHLIRLWCPSMCHNEFGQGTLYTILVITPADRRALFSGLTLLIAAWTRSRYIRWPRDLTYPIKYEYDCPVVVPCRDINPQITSSSWSSLMFDHLLQLNP